MSKSTIQKFNDALDEIVKTVREFKYQVDEGATPEDLITGMIDQLYQDFSTAKNLGYRVINEQL